MHQQNRWTWTVPGPRAVAFGLGALLALGLAVQPGWAEARNGPPGPEASWLLDDSPLPGAPEGLPTWNLRVAGSVLRERVSTDTVTVSTSGGCVYNNGGSAFGVLNAPVYLPRGSNVLALRMYYNDTSASDSTAWFTIYDLNGDIVDEFSVSSTGSGGNGFNDSAAINHVVDYNLYSYVLNWRPFVAGTTMQLCGFRIFYNPPSEIFIDGFETGNTSRWSSTIP